MKSLTLITHHYNGHERVRALLSHLDSFPPSIKEQILIIVVDDNSPQEEALPKTTLDAVQYRVLTDIPWNQPGARNLGIFMCSTSWSLLFDIDQHPKEAGLEYILANLKNLDRRAMYSFRVENYFDANDNCALDVHPNTLLVSTEHFKEFGMYDEDFSGNYAHEDLYLAVMWERQGGKRLVLGGVPFFEDTGQKTPDLSRNLEPNRTIAHNKIYLGSAKPTNLIRFNWKRLTANEF